MAAAKSPGLAQVPVVVRDAQTEDAERARGQAEMRGELPAFRYISVGDVGINALGGERGHAASADMLATASTRRASAS
jgi:hypothetical protein